MKRIVYTRPDKGVSILCPGDALHYMRVGGGFLTLIGTSIAREVEKDVARGIASDRAARWHTAVELGGCTEGEAYGLLAQKDVPNDSSRVELWHVDRLPRDPWFRNAWRQGNSRIVIDMTLAADIQASRVLAARAAAIKQWRADVERDLMLGRRSNIIGLIGEAEDMDLDYWGGAIRSARTPRELRAVWPQFLPVAL